MNIFRVIKNELDCSFLQKDLNNLCDYCSTNLLELNITKCNVITFTRKSKPIVYNYQLNGNVLGGVNEVRDLGIYLDSKLTYGYHVNLMTAKAYKMLGFVLRIAKDFKDRSTLTTLYFAFVRSVLEYGSVVWNPQYKKYIDNIESIQNKFIKHLKFKYNNFKAVKDISLPALTLRRMERDQLFLFKILNHFIDSPFLLSNIYFRCPRSNSRNHAVFSVPLTSTNYASNSFLLRACANYNKNLKNIDIFGSAIGAYRRAARDKLYL